MKKITLIIFMAIMPFFGLNASNISVSGNISTNTTWTGVDTVKVTGDIQINNGITLTIDPGIFVEFQGHYSLEVDGRLLAVGTASDTITFTASNQSNGWNSIVFDNTLATNDSSKIVHCHLEYGKANSFGFSENGGAIYLSYFNKVLISHCSFSNNFATDDGGALYCYSADIKISNSTFSNNNADRWGGALMCGNSDIELENCDINNNSALTGGGIFIEFCNPVLINNLIQNNSATYGSGIYFSGSAAVLINNTITNNSNKGVWCDNDSDPVFRNTIIYGNTVHEVYLNSDSDDPHFYYCDIEGGASAFGGSGSGAYYNGDYDNCLNTDPQFIGSGEHPYDLLMHSPCIDSGDPATTETEAGEFDLSGDVRIQNGIIDIGAYENLITSFEISGNISADTTWTGVDTVKVVGDIFINNGVTLTIDPGIVVEFQGHYKIDVQGTLLAIGTASDHITFTAANHSTGWNRIVFDYTPAANDSSKIAYCNLEYGKANSGDYSKQGGAISVYSFAKVLVSNCLMTNNYADYFGGAIYCRFAPIRISGCTFQNNVAEYWGGALYLSSSDAVLENCEINSNSADYLGSGIYVSAYNPLLINNLIRNNSNSSGIYIEHSIAILLNNSIINNNGIGVKCQNDSDPVFRNTIIYGNNNDNVFLESNSDDPDFYYCDIEGGTSGIGGPGSGANFTGDFDNCINANPQFTGSGNHPYDLSENSPCINVGDPATTIDDVGEFDLAGDNRIKQGIIDIGAYESLTSSDDFSGNALEFDGIDDFVEINDSIALNGDYTIEFWFNTSLAGQRQDILAGTISGEHGILIEITSGNLVRFLHRNPPGTTGGINVYSSASYNDGEWHHLTAQKNGSEARLYLDGSLAGSGSGATDFTEPLDVLFGKLKPNTSERFFNGKLDEIRFWNYARSIEDIRENMHLTSEETEAGLTNYWQFNASADSIAIDIIAGNNGILINMDIDNCWVDSTVPIGGGQSATQIVSATGSVYFDDAGVQMDFNQKTGADTIVVTRIDTIPNINPVEPAEVFDSQYWVINKFGDGTFSADFVFSVNEDITPGDENNPYKLELYSRQSNAFGDWAFSTSASSVNATTNQATFDNITSFSQFIIAREIAHDIELDLTAFLQGPYDNVSGLMITDLNPDDIPLEQPYNISPWNYAGTETLTEIPTDMVDWVLIELRDAADSSSATPATQIAMQAALLMSDGSIKTLDGTGNPMFESISVNQNLYAIIWHRNHLPVMSANGATEASGVYTYDFTIAAEQAYGDNQADLGNGSFGLFSGNLNADGIINMDDILLWNQQAGKKGYLMEDANLDAEVDNKDKNDLWYQNQNKEQMLPE